MPYVIPLHTHRGHRRRQLRWVLPVGILLFLAVLASFYVLYSISNEQVQANFVSAHKAITHTGQMFEHGLWVAVGVLTALVIGIGYWAFHVTHRIVRPVHALHTALDQLVTGDLGVRVEVHTNDEFQEVAGALNQLVEEFSGTLGRVHALVDRMDVLADAVVAGTADRNAVNELHRLTEELDNTMEFFQHANPPRVVREES